MGVMDKFLNYMKLNEEDDDYYDDDYYDEPVEEKHRCWRKIKHRKRLRLRLRPCGRRKKILPGWKYV